MPAPSNSNLARHVSTFSSIGSSLKDYCELGMVCSLQIFWTFILNPVLWWLIDVYDNQINFV